MNAKQKIYKKNCKLFKKELETYQWWDFSFLYNFMIAILLDMEVNTKKNGHSTKAYINKIVKQIKDTRLALTRILNEDHCNKEFNKYYKKYPFKLITVTEGPDAGISRKEEYGRKAETAFRKLINKEAELEKKDWDIFLGNFKESQDWWD